MQMSGILLAQQTRADPASGLSAVAHVSVIPSSTNLRAGHASSTGQLAGRYSRLAESI
jgi:hypothetical protein